MTYTDLAENFAKDEAEFQKIWNSMATAQIKGTPPKRFENLIRYGVIGGGLMLLFAVFGLIRKRRSSRMYEDLGNTVYDEDAKWDEEGTPMTQSGVWVLNSNHDLELASDHPSMPLSSMG